MSTQIRRASQEMIKMIRRTFLAAGAATLIPVVTALAQIGATPITNLTQVAGTWSGKFQNGSYNVSMTVKPDGVVDANGPGVNVKTKAAVKDGKLVVDGNGVSFVLELKGGALESKRGSFGTTNGDIKLTKQ